MRRRHGIEIHEQAWCPASLRDAATDFLQFAANVGAHYRNTVPILRSALQETAARRVVDLCSGGGGPWLTLHRELAREPRARLPITLTDLHPNREAFRHAAERTGGVLRGSDEPVDATRVPAALDGFRTLFGSFHHFRPEAARGILQDAVAKKQGIGVFDASREPAMLLTVLLGPLLVLALVPFIRPFRLSRLVWTYLIPALPLLATFDGIVSCLRCYTPDELRALSNGLEGVPYHWETGRAPMPMAPFHVTYLVGWPSEPASSGPATSPAAVH